MAPTDLLVGLAVLVGLVGIVVPVLPGTMVILAAILVWAIVTGSPAAWFTFGGVTLLLGAGAVVKYAVPSRRLQAVGVPTRTVVVGGLLGVVGFFVIPVIGLLVGFVLGVYLSELQRVGRAHAWTTSKAAMRAAGLSMLIELTAGLAAAVTWLAAAVALG
jgi:uncharacterized protein YqgC (DUF456 family)